MEWILNPWPWYVSGPLIALIMFLLLMVGKKFGMSSNLETLCAMGGAERVSDLFKFDWKTKRWNLIVVVGAILGGFIAFRFLSGEVPVAITQSTVEELHSLGFNSAGKAYLPTELFDLGVFMELKNLSILVIGGLLIGFGTRYASGCTSGHAISGLSNLQSPSLIAVIGFFIGGLFMIHILFPLIF